MAALPRQSLKPAHAQIHGMVGVADPGRRSRPGALWPPPSASEMDPHHRDCSYLFDRLWVTCGFALSKIGLRPWLVPDWALDG